MTFQKVWRKLVAGSEEEFQTDAPGSVLGCCMALWCSARFEPQPGTHCYHCPQNNLFQREGVSHLGGSQEKFKNIKQISPKSLEKKKKKWQKIFGGLELWIGFKPPHFWYLSSLLCLSNHFQMTQLAMPMRFSTAIFFSLLSRWKSPQSQKTSPGKRWH